MAAESMSDAKSNVTFLKQKNLKGLSSENYESPRGSKLRSTKSLYFCIGFLIGLIFPLLGASIDALYFDRSFLDSLFLNSHPHMYVLALLPFIFALAAYVFGLQQDKLKEFNQLLEARASEKDTEFELNYDGSAIDRVRHQHFIDLLPFGGVFVDDNSITLNPKAEEILGYRKSDLTSVTDWFQILFPNDSDVQKRAYLDDRMKGFPLPVLASVKRKNGTNLFLEISRHIDEKGEVWLLNDLTHQLQLQNERNIKSEILEKTSDEILILDDTLNIISQNLASERKVGPLLKSQFINTLPESKRAPFEKQVLSELKEQHFWHGQIQLIDETGDEYPVLLRLFAHFDPILQKSFYSALITDLSEIEMERYKSIQTAKLASIGELAAGVGHEINNPLAILRANYEQCLRLVDKQAPYEKLKLQLEKQDSAIDRITKIADALRIYARGEKLQFEPISVHQGVRDTLNLIEAMFNRYQIQIISELKAEDDIILGNLGQIQQVLMNLLSNARDALENSPTKKITITTRNECDFFYLSVSDTGQGMDEKTKQKIFQPFFTTKARGKGTGMGTSISLGIIRNHQGQFDFSSKINEGTTFWFKIKTAKSSAQEASRMSSSSLNDLNNLGTQEPKKKRALVVDDEPEIRDILRFILEKAGIEVVEAADGVEGISQTKQAKFDLIVCDIQMPNLDGFGMLNQLREDSNFTGKFILITGGIQSNRSTKGQQEMVDSIDGFLRKPFSDDELLETIMNLDLLPAKQ